MFWMKTFCIFGINALIIRMQNISLFKMGICKRLISYVCLEVLYKTILSNSYIEKDWVDILVEIRPRHL